MQRNKYQNQNLADELRHLGLSAPRIGVMNPIYFGQCAEDYIVLSALRSLASSESLDLTQHRYLEIGANHPVATSATYLLRIGLGMTGVLVDANKSLIPELQKARPHDQILNVAVTDDPTLTKVEFYISDHSELSSLDQSFIEKFPDVKASIEAKVTVPATTVNKLLKDNFSALPPLFVSIDVEGMDARIIESLDLTDSRPYLIQVETNKDWDEGSFRSIQKSLASQGYKSISQTDVNAIFVDTRRLQPAAAAQPPAELPTDYNSFRTLGLTMDSLKSILSEIDVLSLDVFDTILYRRCLEPTDVFGYLENKTNTHNLKKKRIHAESRSRETVRPNIGREVSIDEIYSSSDGIPPHIASPEIELHVEKKFLRAQPDVRAIITLARQMGKRIIAISDIYLSSEKITTLLEHAGIFVDKVYTSCEYRDQNLGKYNGKLYKHVAAEEGLSVERILHIGDNIISDVLNGRKAGVNALHVKTVPQLLREDRLTGHLAAHAFNTSASIALGQIAAHQFENKHQSDFYRIGYSIGGPLVLGFAKYILTSAESSAIKHLNLLTRDGIILNEVLKILAPAGITWRIAPASRRLACFPLYATKGWSAISSMFPETSMTRRDFLTRLSLEAEEPWEHSSEKFPPESIAQDLDETLKAHAKAEAQSLQTFYRESIDQHRRGDRMAWVDVGWALSSIAALNEVLEIDAGAFFIGSHSKALDKQDFHGYLFQAGQPQETCQSIMAAVELIELLLSDDSASASRIVIDQNGKPVVHYTNRANEDILRGKYIKEIQKGILDFVSAIHDLTDGLNSEELREYNRNVLSSLSKLGPEILSGILPSLPHDRSAGRSEWQTIGDFWKSSGADLHPKRPTNFYQSLNGKGALSILIDTIAIVALNGASRFWFVSSKSQQRFKRSALKRASRLGLIRQ